MELDHDFTVAADADAAWPVLLDVERMHPLVPGAVYESGADGEYHGRLRIKFGPTTVTYRGTVRIAVVDDLTRTAILEITAREARGQGTVSGSLQATVLPSASSARVVLHTKLTFTGGRAASLSEHLVHDTGAKLLTRFSTNLNALLTSPAKPEPPAAEPVTIDAEELAPLEAPAPALLETEPSTVETTLAEPITIDAEELAPAEAPAPALLETEPSTVETTLAEPITIDAEELAPLEAPAPSPAETAPAERSAGVETEPLTLEAAPAETVTVGAEELVSAEAPAPAPVETASVEAVSVEQGAAGAESPKAGGVGRVESGEGHRSELELYELSERAGWLRRVLPVFGVLVVVLVVRRFLRRR
ncbi:SRPBCC family protein [Actinocorallia aurantiaca]|uniref:Carbon monoxide dehydrogenase subunit G n=1 Tax=Actinocorallia aurantiaca TaxID=46204 RepID=A0ABN3TTD0_9ACTN